MELQFTSWVDDLTALDAVWSDTLHDELEQYPDWTRDDEGFREYHPDERPVLFKDRTLDELTERIADLETRKQALDAESVRLQAQVHVLRLRQYQAEVPESADGDPDDAEGSVEIDAHEAAVRDLMPALRLSYRSTSTRLHQARRLVEEHPAVLAAYAAGTVTWAQRQSIREHLDVLTHRDGELRTDPATGTATGTDDLVLGAPVLDAAQVAAAQDRLIATALQHAPSCTNAQLNRRLAAQVLAELPGHEPAAVQRRERGRRVTFTPCEDGVSTHVSATVDTGLALLLQRHLTACADAAADHSARAGTPDPRSDHARVADVFTDMVRGFLRHGAPAGSDPLPPVVTVVDERTGELTEVPVLDEPRPRGGRTHRPASSTTVHLTIAASTAAGLDDLPGQVAGFGPVPAGVARTLAAGVHADATWWRVLTDPVTAQVMDVSARSYAPSAHLRRLVQAAHPTCVGFGCEVPAVDCDLDHVVPFARGGLTVRANLVPRCRREHRWKTQPFLRDRTRLRSGRSPAPPDQEPPGDEPPY